MLSRVPEPFRKTAVAILPEAWVRWLRRAMMRPYRIEYVVAPESRLARFVKRRVLRLYYPPSMVSRQSALARRVDTLLGRKPQLYHFEIHVTDHCNLNCKGCIHFSNLAPPTFIDEESFTRDMAAMAKLFDVRQVYVMGGEALLHPRIERFIRIARDHFPNAHLVLLTNGLLLTRMDEDFWRALSHERVTLMCTSYPVRLPVDEIEELARIHDVQLEWTEKRSEFYRIPIDVDGRQDGTDAFRRCDGVGNCPIVRDGRLYPCAYAAYADLLVSTFGLTGLQAAERDSLDILEPPGGTQAMRFMRHPIPWCRHCDFDRFSVYEWERSQRSLDEWTGQGCDSDRSWPTSETSRAQQERCPLALAQDECPDAHGVQYECHDAGYSDAHEVWRQEPGHDGCRQTGQR